MMDGGREKLSALGFGFGYPALPSIPQFVPKQIRIAMIHRRADTR